MHVHRRPSLATVPSNVRGVIWVAAMSIIEFIRDRARFYNCPVCGRSLKGCDVQVLSHEDESFRLQVTCAQCQVTFIVVLAIAGGAMEEIENAIPDLVAEPVAEDQSVLASIRHRQEAGREVRIAGVDRAARVDPDAIRPGTALVSVGLANNEVGTIQPVAQVIERARDVGALVHLDACAGARWIPIPDGADIVSISGHKLGAGRGGLVFVRAGVRIDPRLIGGPQEWGRRAGHEDVASATAVATALSVCVRQRASRVEAAGRLRRALHQALLGLGGTFTGGQERLPNFATCTFADRRGEDILMALDLAGIAASSGSACASGSLDPSHVLLAMGLSLEEALGSLRLTTGYNTTDEDIAAATSILQSVLMQTPARA